MFIVTKLSLVVKPTLKKIFDKTYAKNNYRTGNHKNFLYLNYHNFYYHNTFILHIICIK